MKCSCADDAGDTGDRSCGRGPFSEGAELRGLGWYRSGRFVLLGIARALAFIHSRDIIIFDINPALQMMLVMEFVGGGNLAKALSLDKAEPRRLGWHRNGRFVLLGIARGLAFIHSRNIIVFDVKAGNVLLDQDGVTAKITDVGLSKMLAGSNTATLLVCFSFPAHDVHPSTVVKPEPL